MPTNLLDYVDTVKYTEFRRKHLWHLDSMQVVTGLVLYESKFIKLDKHSESKVNCAGTKNVRYQTLLRR
ncbi:predicted protein [Sclerotinia sclerotiorum 1980 UF-70]|uniref:Uncharacterized protein n=1 Tax=Sclerotinia sclerotiorum (strain ATCC 18683 / 1980 / Ss-1) TaxID=665079 RepID=A7ES02_SCLS1|nr:predicted protein [Sclerotinia sclerotiorum 1980 UF-70]EDN92244.1 predicted protein [Sclerotinia sclerotiorum 1980 UF-70]